MTPDQQTQLAAMVKTLGDLGVSFGDISKTLKIAKADGVIKSAKGKGPSDNPNKIAVRDLILASNAMDVILPNLDGSKSFQAHLGEFDGNTWSVNFVMKVPRVAKAKTAEPAKPTSEPAELA